MRAASTNFPRGDLHGKDHEFPPGTKPEACQELCDNTVECEAWTFLKRGRTTRTTLLICAIPQRNPARALS